MKKVVLIFLSILMLFTSVAVWEMPTVSLAEENEFGLVGTVTGGKLNMRSTPSATGKVIGTYNTGAQMNILENDGTWCYVEKNGKKGYVMTQYLEISTTYSHLGWGETAKSNEIHNIRSRADATSDILFKFSGNIRMEVLESEGNWYNVRIGNIFGFLESDHITLLDGDYSIATYSDENNPYHFDESGLNVTRREIGSQKSQSSSESGFVYAANYPILSIGTADTDISSWIQDIISKAKLDYETNHTDGTATLSLNYQAELIDGRYASIVLGGMYQVEGYNQVTLFHPLLIDTQTGKLLASNDLFANNDRVLFQIESKLTSILGSGNADGYTVRPDEDVLNSAALTQEGVTFFCQSGSVLPATLGAQKISVPYELIAGYMKLDTPTVTAGKRVIDPQKPMIALTFDDGPSEETEKILAALDEYGGRATFCVVGNRIDTYADVLKEIVASGNEVACHTWSHKRLTELSAANVQSQITRVTDLVYNLTGYTIKVLRPPYGSTNKSVRTVCSKLDLIIALWEVDTSDWETRSKSTTYKNIIRGARNGAIILCHDIYSSTAAAVVQAIPELIASGYQLVTVSELMSFHKDGVKAGTVYSRLDPENIDTGE